VADQVDALVLRTLQLFQRKLISPNRPLRVCYMLPHHNITGGMKCLVEHIRLLRQRGHYTIAVHRSDSAQRAMPPWTTVEAGKEATCCTSHSPTCVVPHVKGSDGGTARSQLLYVQSHLPANALYWTPACTTGHSAAVRPADVDVVCNLHQRLSDVYPVQNIDVVVVGIFHQVGMPASLCWQLHCC